MTESILSDVVNGIFATLGVGITTFGTYYLAKKVKGRNTTNNIDEEEEEINLYTHHIFTKINFNKNVMNSRFKLNNKGKEEVFREIILTHLQIFRENMFFLIEKIKEKDGDEYYNLSVDTLNSIVYGLNGFYRDGNFYSKEEKKVLEIVMSKYNYWNKEREDEFLNRIQDVCTSKVYQDDSIRSSLILDTFMYLINDIVADASKTLNTINGDLRGLKFKGVVI